MIWCGVGKRKDLGCLLLSGARPERATKMGTIEHTASSSSQFHMVMQAEASGTAEPHWGFIKFRHAVGWLARWLTSCRARWCSEE